MLPFFRRKYMNDKPFQISFILYSWGMAGFVILTVYFGIYTFFRQSYARLVDMGLPQDAMLLGYLSEQQQKVRLVCILSFIIIFICMGFFGLLMSHRVAGPLTKVRKYLRAMSAGERVDKIGFRQKDFFQDLAADLNKLRERLPENS